MPIGWPDAQLDEVKDAWEKRDVVKLALKALGCFWTALALSLGAPFWFDLLQKFMNFRGAGPKPETTADKVKKEK